MTLATFEETSCPMSGWSLLGQLLRGDISPAYDTLWRQPLFRVKFLTRGLLHPVLTMRWLHYIAQHPWRTQILSAHRTLPAKLQRPYLSLHHTPPHALSALCFHYNEMACLPSTALRTALLTPTESPVARVSGKSNTRYPVVLSAFSSLDKEGEVTLQFMSEDMPLSRLTLTLTHTDGKKTLFIGGQQGPHRHLAQQRERIQQVTRDCHGLFPKRIAMEAVCCLGKLLGVAQIVAVSNQTHIYHSWRYWRRKKASFHADYNAFWSTLGGQPRPDGLYQLPLRIERKPLSEVASKKRAEYQRANLLLADLYQHIQQFFS